MIGNDDKVQGYFYWNKINLNKNCKLFGSLEFGGLSNYWGLQMDPDILNDIKNLSKKNKERYVQIELLQEFNLAGKLKNMKTPLKDDFFSIKKKNTSLKFEEFVVGYKNSFSEKKKLIV